MPNPKKPTDLKVVQGTFRPDRDIAPGSTPQFAEVEGVPPPPIPLDEIGAAVWAERVPQLAATRVLRETDLRALAIYCDAFDLLESAREELAAHGVTIIGAMGGRVKNPAATVKKEAIDTIAKFGAMFGLDPVARSRINVGKSGNDDPLDGLLPPAR